MSPRHHRGAVARGDRRRAVKARLAHARQQVTSPSPAAVLEIGTRSTAFFAAVSDKLPEAKNLQAELDRTLEKLIATLRRPKGS